MGKKNSNEIIVGMTVVGVLALAVYIIVLLADFSRLTTDYQKITFKLPYEAGLQGLSVGSPVNLGGYKIGEVVDTEISVPEKTEPDRIYVLFSIEVPKHYHLHKNCVLVPEVNLLGSKAELNIDNLGDSVEMLNDGDIEEIVFGNNAFSALKNEIDLNNPDSILSSIKTELNRENEESLLGALSSTARKLKTIATNVEKELSVEGDKGETILKEFKAAVTNINEITETLHGEMDKSNSLAMISRMSSAMGKFDDSMDGFKEIVTGNKDDIHETISSLKNTAKQLEKDMPELTKKIDIIFDKASSGLDTAKEALIAFKSTGESANSLVEVNKDKIDKMIDNITEVSSNLKLVSEEVRRAPWRLLYKPEKKEMEIQATVDTAAAFAAGAERLDNAANSLKKAVGQLGDGVAVGGEKVKQIIAELENSFDEFHKAEEKLWEEME